VTAPGTGNNLLVRAQLLRVLAGIACAGSLITLIPYPVVAFLSCLVLTWHLLTWHLLTWHMLTWHMLTWHMLTWHLLTWHLLTLLMLTWHMLTWHMSTRTLFVSLQWYVTIAGQVSAPWGYTDYAPPSIASFEGTGARCVRVAQPLPSHFWHRTTRISASCVLDDWNAVPWSGSSITLLFMCRPMPRSPSPHVFSLLSPLA
jgi:hypothetical protein